MPGSAPYLLTIVLSLAQGASPASDLSRDILAVPIHPPQRPAGDWRADGVVLQPLSWVSERLVNRTLDRAETEAAAQPTPGLTLQDQAHVRESVVRLLRRRERQPAGCLAWNPSPHESPAVRYETKPLPPFAGAVARSGTSVVGTVEEVLPGLSLPFLLTTPIHPGSLVLVRVEEQLAGPKDFVSSGALLRVLVTGGLLRIGKEAICGDSDPSRPLPEVGDQVLLLGALAAPGSDAFIVSDIAQVRGGVAYPPRSERFLQEPVSLEALRSAATTRDPLSRER